MLIFGPDGGQTLDPIIVLLLALVAEPWLSGLAARLLPVAHPVRLMGRLIEALERRLNRADRTPTMRRAAGIATVAVVSGLAAVIGILVHCAARAHPLGLVLEAALVISLLAQRSLYDHVGAVATALEQKGLDGGRAAVAHIVGRDVSVLDEHGVARAAIESCAENFSDGIVAPTFWFVVFGLPGLLAYKAVNTMDSMIGHTSPRYLAFGMAAARLDDMLNWMPARLSGAFLAAAAWLSALPSPARAAAAFRTMTTDAGKHRSPNAGWPEAAMAGALGLALAGPRRYPGVIVDGAWIGSGRAEATAEDVRRALRLLVIGCLINATAVTILAAATLTQ
jgi:adenosylcobinamide-phosphate synthase